MFIFVVEIINSPVGYRQVYLTERRVVKEGGGVFKKGRVMGGLYIYGLKIVRKVGVT